MCFTVLIRPQSALMYRCSIIAFLLACNVVLEISGDTSAIQRHFDTTTSKSSTSLSFGPFSVSKSNTDHTENSSAKCETTSTGCRCVLDTCNSKHDTHLNIFRPWTESRSRRHKSSDGFQKWCQLCLVMTNRVLHQFRGPTPSQCHEKYQGEALALC